MLIVAVQTDFSRMMKENHYLHLRKKSNTVDYTFSMSHFISIQSKQGLIKVLQKKRVYAGYKCRMHGDSRLYQLKENHSKKINPETDTWVFYLLGWGRSDI